ncbi:hypothetical protein SMACR_07963 [Sordaria macrospora]|uniref:WGS project CABT00000000 data, contig 2.48 n=2 Tax=Sordaria macrospora TaxID=5147 RepID=F7W912_SORMK|nr:uncharacterized protein SMAC_07963 [Sordaria macrospora k-hell]KAA8631956.1 hypothetical protein SMACR_07963 [Sordaria macrospora]WPJ61143.1 hypothetical protein SMAC4_07963 [Sordaria macrospora]CCC13893.1 unnamed protein product [Sordaria macrospora k-hell]
MAPLPVEHPTTSSASGHEYEPYIPTPTLRHVPVSGWVLISLLFGIFLGSYILGQCLTWGNPTLTEKEWRRRREEEMEEAERVKEEQKEEKGRREWERMERLRRGDGLGNNGNGGGNGGGSNGTCGNGGGAGRVERLGVPGMPMGGAHMGGMGASRLSGSTLGKAQGWGAPLGK